MTIVEDHHNTGHTHSSPIQPSVITLDFCTLLVIHVAGIVTNCRFIDNNPLNNYPNEPYPPDPELNGAEDED